jgi:hypothetical protein
MLGASPWTIGGTIHERSSCGFAFVEDVDGRGELTGTSGTAAELAQHAPGLELGAGPLAGARSTACARLGLLLRFRLVPSLVRCERVLVPLSGADLDRMAELVETYGDFPRGLVDASVIAIAERLGADAIAASR